MNMEKWDLVEILDEIKLVKGNENFTIIDIETTGFNPKKGSEIIQVAAAKVRFGNVVNRFASFVKPNRKIPKKITELTGITNDDVRYAPKLNTVLWSLKAFAEDDVLVFHNAQFDWKTFLKPLMENAMIPARNEVLCTFQTYFKAEPGLGKGGYTNEKMAKEFGFVLTNAHQADADVEATAHSLLGLKRAFDSFDVQEIENRKEAEEKKETPVAVKSINFWGKEIEGKEFKRQYVKIEGEEGKGTVFYDVVNKKWRNQNYPGKIKYNFVEKAIFEWLGIKSIEEFESYRPAKA